MEAHDARQRVERARVGHLATVTAGGRPHVVPVCFALVGDRVYSVVDAKPKTTLALKRLDNIRSRPAVAVLVDAYDEQWRDLWWVRIDGTGRISESGPEREDAVTALAEKYPQYRRSPPPGAVIAVEITQWHWWP